jgi:3'-phosphoadenosine 5'-phosphosulfate sulfotransferase (PAPS reductase)/FAD synthetase
MRFICNFSCGAASAVATKLVLGEYGLSHEVLVVNALVKEEHPDNRRFLDDCAKWFGVPITVVQNEKYGASARDVFRRRRFLKSKQGAPCSKILKREVLDVLRRHDDTVVLGYTAEEQHRLDAWIDANNDMRVVAPLIEQGLGKADVLAMVQRAGIELPMMYRLGYHNANCIGCVKGGAGYWNKIRKDFPADFEEMAQIEKSIGPGARLLRHRSGPLKGQRFYLHELAPDVGQYRYQDEPDISCSAACEFVEQSQVWDELYD